MFQAKVSKERLDVVKSLMACKPKPGASICAFVLKMKGYFNRLESLNMVFDAELSINIIVSGMPADYNQFVLSYQMNGKETSIMELHSLLQTAEQGIKKIDVPSTSTAHVLTVGHNAKKKRLLIPTGNGKGRKWKMRSCPYLSEGTQDGKVEKGSHSSMFMIELHNTTTLDLWVLDTGCGTHICIVLHDLKESRRLKHGELNLILNVGSSNDLDKSKLWHSHLGHINKKRIAQLQKDGVLESFDFKSDDVCESCLLGKMTKSPFTGSCEREDNESKIDLEEIQESADEEPIVNTDTQQEVVTPVKPDDISLPIRRTSGRVSKRPRFYYGFHIKEDKISDSTLSELNEPANYKEAMNLIDTTPGLKTVGCKWIFKKKTDMDGKVHTYKARLVAKGYTQIHMIDYEETFPPVAKIKSIRIMLAITAFNDYEIWQRDVKTAFLNKKLIKDVFMAQPEGFENEKYSKRVCKLQKAIHRLKQASRSWNLYFHEKVTQFQISRSEDESCIYVKVSGNVIVFLDTYLDKILKRFKTENSKKGNLPLHHSIKISKDLCLKTDEELDRMSRVPYASTVGSIMYTMTCTRFLVYGGEEELRVTGYYDASWQTDKDDSRSQSGWVFLLNGGAVTWKSSKQDTVADSTCESEYIAACEASKEAIWMKNFIGDLGVVPTVQDPIEIFCDNESAVALTKEPKDHGKSKHIERKYHFVRSKVEEGHVIVKHIRSEDNPADPFTKALAKSRHDEHARSIGLKDNIKF
ncbi:retrotransposon protein, putative, ty1-copia subclass [Tanacetum coccineum]